MLLRVRYSSPWLEVLVCANLLYYWLISVTVFLWKGKKQHVLQQCLVLWKRNDSVMKNLVYYVEEKWPHHKIFLALYLVSIYYCSICLYVCAYMYHKYSCKCFCLCIFMFNCYLGSKMTVSFCLYPKLRFNKAYWLYLQSFSVQGWRTVIRLYYCTVSCMGFRIDVCIYKCVAVRNDLIVKPFSSLFLLIYDFMAKLLIFNGFVEASIWKWHAPVMITIYGV